MPVQTTRVIVVTSSLAYYQIIKNGLIALPETELIIQAGSEGDIYGKLNRAQKNFVIFDLNTVTATYAYISQMVERHQVIILWSANTKTHAIPLLKGNIRNFLAKPPVCIGAAAESYLKELVKIYKGFAVNVKLPTFQTQQKLVNTNDKIVAIASSTGGPEALEKIFRELPADIPPILVVQHMPSGFTRLFANRLNGICKMEIREASNNDCLQKGLILIAPADLHMVMVKQSNRLAVECYKGSKVHGVMPAADVLFDSVGPLMRKNALGVVLTGMGADGGIGLKNMHNSGAFTIGQDKATSVVYGMPKVAYDLGAVDAQLPIERIAAKIMEWAT